MTQGKLCCQSDGALERAVQRGGGFSSSGDALHGCPPVRPDVGNLGLDSATSRGPFQSLQLCGSVWQLWDADLL